MLYLCGVTFVLVLPLPLLAVVAFIRTRSAPAVVHASAAAAAAAAAIRRVVYTAAAVRTATKNGTMCVVLDVLRYLSALNDDCFLRPLAVRNVACTAFSLFDHDTLDCYGLARSRRQASARRVETPLVFCIILRTKIETPTFVTRHPTNLTAFVALDAVCFVNLLPYTW